LFILGINIKLTLFLSYDGLGLGNIILFNYIFKFIIIIIIILINNVNKSCLKSGFQNIN
jgi:hypothetical protein